MSHLGTFCCVPATASLHPMDGDTIIVRDSVDTYRALRWDANAFARECMGGCWELEAQGTELECHDAIEMNEFMGGAK